MCGRAPWKLPAAIASRTVTSDGSGSYSTSTAAAPSRAASSVSPSTQHTACPWNITSRGNSGSSCLTPGVVHARDVGRGEHPHHPGHVVAPAPCAAP